MVESVQHQTAVTLDRPPNLPQTLAHARMGSGDPCLRVVDGAVWRATRTPLGLATQRLSLGTDGAVHVDLWGPGQDWLVPLAPALCGAHDKPDSFMPDQPL